MKTFAFTPLDMSKKCVFLQYSNVHVCWFKDSKNLIFQYKNVFKNKI